MRPVHIIGVSLDLGGNRRGVDMGPSAFRIAGLGERLTALGITVVDEGDLVAPIPEVKSFGDPRKKYIREIARVCEKLYKTSLAALEKGGFPLVLGGDHSLAAGSVAATAEFVRRSEKPTRPDLGRRARRHEHARELRQRQRPRHAARVAARAGAGRAVADRRLLAEGAARRTPCSSASATSTTREKEIVRARRRPRLHDEGHRSLRASRRSSSRRSRSPATAPAASTSRSISTSAIRRSPRASARR